MHWDSTDLTMICEFNLRSRELLQHIERRCERPPLSRLRWSTWPQREERAQRHQRDLAAMVVAADTTHTAQARQRFLRTICERDGARDALYEVRAVSLRISTTDRLSNQPTRERIEQFRCRPCGHWTVNLQQADESVERTDSHFARGALGTDRSLSESVDERADI